MYVYCTAHTLIYVCLLLAIKQSFSKSGAGTKLLFNVNIEPFLMLISEL